MAATEPAPDIPSSAVASKKNSPTGALLAAALALPGILPAAALAQLTPDPGLIELKYLDYRDWQSGADRIRVHTPSFYARKPLSDSLQAEGSIVYDSVSGASPLYYNALSGASHLGVTDYRTAGDAKLTKYFDQFAVGVGAAVSSERDYLSRALSLDVRVSSDDRNRTFAFGLGGASDRINSTNGLAEGKERHTLDFLAGITQALSPDAIVQSNVTYSSGYGYYSDPYKKIDARPDHRRIFTSTRRSRRVSSPDSPTRRHATGWPRFASSTVSRTPSSIWEAMSVWPARNKTALRGSWAFAIRGGPAKSSPPSRCWAVPLRPAAITNVSSKSTRSGIVTSSTRAAAGQFNTGNRLASPHRFAWSREVVRRSRCCSRSPEKRFSIRRVYDIWRLLATGP